MTTNVVKSPDQIRRVTALRNPPRTARMNYTVAGAIAARARWQDSQPGEDGTFERDFERHDREIVKSKRRVRRTRIVG